MDKTNFACIKDTLKTLAVKTIGDCTFTKDGNYFSVESKYDVLLPSGDEKYYSFWVRDAAMMAESGLLPNEVFKKYIEIFATHAQNGGDTRFLENGLTVPPFAIADHINYDGKPVFFPGTYSSGENQGDGSYGFFPPFCDNYYFIIMVWEYVKQSEDFKILNKEYNGISLLQRLKYAFLGYNIDSASELCVSEKTKFTIDWGFVDTVKKSGKLLMASLLRYNAAMALYHLLDMRGDYNDSKYYSNVAQKIKSSVLETFYDESTGWFYSATGIGHQYDVWGTAYAVYSGITSNEKTLAALYMAYKNHTSVVDGYVRHILTDNDYSQGSAWECTKTAFNEYQNGAYWATPTGWYAYALYQYNGEIGILEDFVKHTEKYMDMGAPFEWIDATTEKFSGIRYGTSGVLPYIAAKRIIKNKDNI